ncbi:MAG: ADP-ribosylglycohydrolase family protein [Planctomycetota bacterium]
MFPVDWSTIIPPKRRQEAIEGFLMGCAVAESLSILYASLDPKTTLSLRRHPVRFWTSMPAYPGSNTHSIVIAIQSLLKSKAKYEEFEESLRKRLNWYRVSHPMQSMRARWRQAALDGDGPEATLSRFGSDPMIRSALMSVVMQGIDSTAMRWISHSARIASEDEMVIQASRMVAMATQCAQVQRTSSSIDTNQLLRTLADSIDDVDLQQRLLHLDGLLQRRESLHRAARSLGYRRGVADRAVENAILAIYAFCLHPRSYRQCIEEVIRLPGNTVGIASLAGAILGAAQGPQDIPKEWLDNVSMIPYDKKWISQCVERVQDWPHGPEDIQRTAILPTRIVGQIQRNLVQGLAGLQLILGRLGLLR